MTVPAYVELQSTYEKPAGPKPSRVPGVPKPRAYPALWRHPEAGREGHRRTRIGIAVVQKGHTPWAVAEDRAQVRGLIPACWGTDADDWFNSRKRSTIEACKAKCRECPLRAACLAGALARYEQVGIWGGVQMVGMGAVSHDHRRIVYDLEEDEGKDVKLSDYGKRRVFIARLIRSIGKPVRVPGNWYVGPWTDPDPDRGLERMRYIVPADLASAPLTRWPKELRALFDASYDPDPGAAADQVG